MPPKPYLRIGQIVPSSNTTMETEIPAMLRAREAAVPIVERQLGVPVVTAAVCTAYRMLQSLGLKAVVPNAGALLSGRHAGTAVRDAAA